MIYDKAYSTSFHRKVEKIHDISALEITGAIRGTSKENLYWELGLESLEKRRLYIKYLTNNLLYTSSIIFLCLTFMCTLQKTWKIFLLLKWYLRSFYYNWMEHDWQNCLKIRKPSHFMRPQNNYHITTITLK